MRAEGLHESQHGNKARKEDQEAEVSPFIARLKQILIVCRERPVVATGFADVLKGLHVLKARPVRSKKLKLLHG